MFRPAAGTIVLRSRCGREFAPQQFRSELGLVFQHLRLAPNLTALTSVLCGRLGREPWWKTLFGFAGSERERARELLTSFGLAGFEHAPVGKLSGGEKQRVAIIRSLMQRPCALFADEPVSHLDSGLSREVLTKLKALAAKENFFLICVLHDEALAHDLADSLMTVSPHLSCGWEFQTSPAHTPPVK